MDRAVRICYEVNRVRVVGTENEPVGEKKIVSVFDLLRSGDYNYIDHDENNVPHMLIGVLSFPKIAILLSSIPNKLLDEKWCEEQSKRLVKDCTEVKEEISLTLIGPDDEIVQKGVFEWDFVNSLDIVPSEILFMKTSVKRFFENEVEGR